MENLSAEYLFRAEAWLLITTLIYFMMNGAGILETAVIIPRWSAAPPASFQIFKGEYGIDLKFFWIMMHSVHEITFIVAIIFCWNLPGIREALLALFVIHLGVRVWTLTYFVPNIIEFQKIANGTRAPANLAERTKRWKNLNYVRTGLFIVVSLGVLTLFVNVLQMMF